MYQFFNLRKHGFEQRGRAESGIGGDRLHGGSGNMTVDPRLRRTDLQTFLATSEQQNQELRGVIASELTSAEDRMQALVELAHLSADLTALLLDVIKAESK